MPILYFLISLLGASLLFMVQPMAAKVALPILGGAPFVWNGCMVFFQTLLLGGYLYAHLLNKSLPVQKQPWVHVPLLALALFAFPLDFGGSAFIDPASQPMGWLLSMLALSVGLPFFVLSATSPLSQRWFAASAPTREPYVLYAASNVGSFAGLLAYPILIEPFLPIAAQAQVLFFGFCLLLGLFALAGWQLRTAPDAATKPLAASALQTPITQAQVLAWIVLAAVPSSLLYGVTTYITTDIASVPLFWVIPLALYLLTFVLIFGNKARSFESWRKLHRLGAPAMVFLTLFPLTYPVPTLLLHLIVFFAATMVCHSKLSDLRPAPAQLTGFFLWVSFGGVLGGVFNSFVAPAVFTSVIEYPMMLVISLAIAAPSLKPNMGDAWKILVVWGVFTLMFWLIGTPHLSGIHLPQPVRLASLLFGGLLLMIVGYIMHRNQPKLLALWVAPALLVCTPLFNHVIDTRDAFAGRNVFGVSRVIWQEEKSAWMFRHGTTYHGMQSTEEALRLKPNSYYVPLIDVVRSLSKRIATAPVAVIGMGVGTVACYGKPKQAYDLFEIDPLVDLIAHDTRYFTYLRDCPPETKIVIGDGRISLARAEDARYGLIVMDAFSSDSIPMHLITKEAVAMYATKLQPGGLLAFNISNRHIDLVPVLTAIAAENGLYGMTRLAEPVGDAKLQLASRWLVLTKDKSALVTLKAISAGWHALPEPDASYLWRDDYSNILRSMKF